MLIGHLHTSTITVPPPEVTITQPTGPHYAGSTVSLACQATINEAVDTGVQISASWTKPGQTDERVTISAVTQTGSHTYESTLTISPLGLQDSGDYNCEIFIEPQPESTLIVGSSGTDSLTFEVTGTYIYMEALTGN